MREIGSKSCEGSEAFLIRGSTSPLWSANAHVTRHPDASKLQYDNDRVVGHPLLKFTDDADDATLAVPSTPIIQLAS